MYFPMFSLLNISGNTALGIPKGPLFYHFPQLTSKNIGFACKIVLICPIKNCHLYWKQLFVFERELQVTVVMLILIEVEVVTLFVGVTTPAGTLNKD